MVLRFQLDLVEAEGGGGCKALRQSGTTSLWRAKGTAEEPAAADAAATEVGMGRAGAGEDGGGRGVFGMKMGGQEVEGVGERAELGSGSFSSGRGGSRESQCCWCGGRDLNIELRLRDLGS